MRWKFIILILGLATGFGLRDLFHDKPAAAKLVTIANRNLQYQVATNAQTVGEVLVEQGYNAPQLTNPVTSGMVIDPGQPVVVAIIDAGKETNVRTRVASVGDLLYEQKIGLAARDQVTPDLGTFLANNSRIIIDRIVDLEVEEASEILYEIRLVHDEAIYYGREELITAGSAGSLKNKFLITYKNGVEVKRKLLSQETLSTPVNEVRKFGTKIEIEEIKEGRASWYAYKACMCAAHPFYDKDRYVKVTSLSSGKSIIVKTNDRGPDLRVFPDRVIDLDAVAFKELAPLGAGTIGVKVELLKN